MKNSDVKEIYNFVDEIIASQKSCCTKGCSYCCHQQIEVQNIEKRVITNYIKDNLDQQTKNVIRKDLEVWLDYFDKNTPDNKVLTAKDVFIDFRNKSAKVGLKCPFLINNACSIYPMRPQACRIHIVEENPQLCNENKLRDSTKFAREIKDTLVDDLKKKEQISIEPLAYVVKDIFLPERKMKQIEKVIL